jgi:hypothetical protein
MKREEKPKWERRGNTKKKILAKKSGRSARAVDARGRNFRFERAERGVRVWYLGGYGADTWVGPVFTRGGEVLRM